MSVQVAFSTTRFQSTLPVRGATPLISGGFSLLKFQSTLPVRGATVRLTAPSPLLEDFNPRSP